ncbi:MAG: ribbon-helix-helix protein, CopG family [Clostridia bacterium]|nr:ribbon-helix-helix protein, CopG family [Clostridia bacterium]
MVPQSGGAVVGVKRIMISLPESLLKEVDGLASLEKRNRSEFIREAMKLYIAERKRRGMREQMKKGYQEMASINLSLAMENYEVENEAQKYYEKQLAEC